jgi:nucleotide-binding universal stress UspA family protein
MAVKVKTILVLIDFPDAAARLVTMAGDLGRALHGRIVLLHVAMPDSDFVGGELRPDFSRQGIAHYLRRKRRLLRAFQSELQRQGADATALMVRGRSARGVATKKILEEIDRRNPDLIIMGTHNHGALHHLLIGSTSEAVIRKSGRAVLLVPTHNPVANTSSG